jgi:hypothetical protein
MHIPKKASVNFDDSETPSQTKSILRKTTSCQNKDGGGMVARDIIVSLVLHLLQKVRSPWFLAETEW